jgi:hypothetical protein
MRIKVAVAAGSVAAVGGYYLGSTEKAKSTAAQLVSAIERR